MKIKEKIEKWTKETLNTGKVILVHPKDIKNGDYSFFSSSENSEKDVERLNENKIKEIEKIEVVGKFINFHLSKEFFAEAVSEINKQKEKFGSNNLLEDQKIIIEYTNTNVLKPMHIGHLMGNVIGESLSRIIENSGAKTKRNTYQGDTGLHIAKAVWGIRKNGGQKEGDLSAKADYIGRSYALGADAYEDDEKAKNEIIEINKKLFEQSDKELVDLYKWGRQVSLDHFEELYKKLSTKFDYYFFESQVAEDALKIVKENIGNVFEESDGAIVFRGEKFDPKLHTRVFVTSQNIPTYEAKDIAHAIRKEKEFKSDKSIIVTANEQDEYFKVVIKTLEQINKEIADKTTHLSHGMLKLPTGKMSSRKGNVITGESLIKKVEELVVEKIKDREFDDKEKNEITEIVAIGAIKYSILRQAIGGDIIFDFGKSISFEGDSGPYLQYTAVRANSVLKNAKKLDHTLKISKGTFDTWETIEVEKMLYRFPEVVERAGKEYAPHHIVTYLTELAAAFNSFYTKEKIIDEANLNASAYKIALTQAIFHTLHNGLYLLGIKVPERM